jgi:maltose alpha-D-glucosyltransferase/alpha-amylase
MRKEHPAFALGTYEALRPRNERILAYIRRYERETLLCSHNLARTPQAAELDLSAFAGLIPEEMLGGTPFPRIGELPYLLTFAGHGFYWFRLRGDDE